MSSQVNGTAEQTEGNEPTVLFVDDEPRVLEGIRNVLAFEPFRVLTANSAAEALEVLATEPVSVVVSDERMPGMNGSELLSVVCRRYPTTVRIVLTGQASIESAIRAINSGQVYRFLTKPFSSDELVNTLTAALELGELADGREHAFQLGRAKLAIRRELEKTNAGNASPPTAAAEPAIAPAIPLHPSRGAQAERAAFVASTLSVTQGPVPTLRAASAMVDSGRQERQVALIANLKEILLEDLLKQESTPDDHDCDNFLDRVRRQGRRDGWRELLRTQLEIKYGDLSEEASRRLEQASPEALQLWAERVLVAQSVAGVLGD